MQNEALANPDEEHMSADHTQGQAFSVNTAVTSFPTNGNSQGLYKPEPAHRQVSSDHGRSPSAQRGQRAPGRPPPLPPYPNTYTSPSRQPSGMRVESPTGGVQVTIDAGGSWSQLARQDATLPADAALNDDKGGSSGGVFGLFGRKKGRGHSPKPKERGVLGKEGARVVIG